LELKTRSVLSSTKLPVVVLVVVSWSEVNRLNSNGAATTPWGTPAQIGNISGLEDPECNVKYLP